MANYGLAPGIPGISYLQNSQIGNLTPYGGPNVVPDSMSSQNLLDGTQYADYLQNVVQTQTSNMLTANTIHSQIASSDHTMSNQAQSFDEQFIGDEIAQEKKSNENAGKAV